MIPTITLRDNISLQFRYPLFNFDSKLFSVLFAVGFLLLAMHLHIGHIDVHALQPSAESPDYRSIALHLAKQCEITANSIQPFMRACVAVSRSRELFR